MYIQSYKDSAHYLKGDVLKGSKDEIEFKINSWLSKQPADTSDTKIEFTTKSIRDTIIHQRYIIWDAETDTSTNIHIPNLIIVVILEVSDDHNYENSKIDRKEFYGYNCCIDLCNWLFSAENKGSTVLAHNGGGYDYKFVLQY